MESSCYGGLAACAQQLCSRRPRIRSRPQGKGAVAATARASSSADCENHGRSSASDDPASEGPPRCTGPPSRQVSGASSEMLRQASTGSTRGRRQSVQHMEDFLGMGTAMQTAFRATARLLGLDKKGIRNSQRLFANPSQTIIIFDWDDTLFPSTYVRDDLKLSVRRPLLEQSVPPWENINDAAENLKHCEQEVSELLRFAVCLGHVIFVTLAREPWVSDSCSNFFPRLYTQICKYRIPIIYAQEGQRVDHDFLDRAPPDEVEQFWASVKGKAISDAVNKFYSQYEGQSWKNIISIGDSNFERLGTWAATEDYKHRTGITTDGCKSTNIDGHMYKVRTKTFKLVDQPTIEELTVELTMVKHWLQHMVNLDDSFDVDLNTIDDARRLKEIENMLSGRRSGMSPW